MELKREQVEEAMRRCGISGVETAEKTLGLRNSSGGPLTPDDTAVLMKTFEDVFAEAKAAEEERQRVHLALKVNLDRRVAAAKAAFAAPYREERLRRKAAAYAKRQPKPKLKP